jgi:hypothetical protein
MKLHSALGGSDGRSLSVSPIVPGDGLGPLLSRDRGSEHLGVGRIRQLGAGGQPLVLVGQHYGVAFAVLFVGGEPARALQPAIWVPTFDQRQVAVALVWLLVVRLERRDSVMVMPPDCHTQLSRPVAATMVSISGRYWSSASVSCSLYQ